MSSSKRVPGYLRRARLVKGVILDEVAAALHEISVKRGFRRGGLSRGELSKVERGLRWVKPEQVAALALYFKVPPGRVCEWILADRGLLGPASGEKQK